MPCVPMQLCLWLIFKLKYECTFHVLPATRSCEASFRPKARRSVGLRGSIPDRTNAHHLLHSIHHHAVTKHLVTNLD